MSLFYTGRNTGESIRYLGIFHKGNKKYPSNKISVIVHLSEYLPFQSSRSLLTVNPFFTSERVPFLLKR